MEAPCPPVVSSAKGDKTDPVAAQMVVLGVLALLRALCAGEDVVAGVVLPWARLVAKVSAIDQRLVVTPMT